MPIHPLPVPPGVEQAPDAVEVLRLWVANGSQHVIVSTAQWRDPAAWGLALVDLARHIARAYEAGGGPPEADALARLREGFDAEWNVPTDNLAGGPLPK
jgi:hypothetical protein